MVIDKLYTQQDFLSCALAGMLIQSMLCSACQPTNMTYDTTIQVIWSSAKIFKIVTIKIKTVLLVCPLETFNAFSH